MEKTLVRYVALTLALLGAAALFALLLTTVAAAASIPHPSPPLPPDDPFFPEPDVWEPPAAAFRPLRSQASTQIESSFPIPLPDPAWRIPVAADGLYRLSYETLAGAGVPVAATAPSAFHLLWRGQEVALQEEGAGDGAFDPGDSFLFYGEKFHGSVQDEKYTDENVYWLVVDDGWAGLRMDSRSVAPGGAGRALDWYTATVRAEENWVYMPRYTTAPETDATWFWERLRHGMTRVYPFTLTAPLSEFYATSLTVELARRYVTGRELDFTLNGSDLGGFTWSGSSVGVTVTLPMSSSLLQEGANALTVTNAGGNTYLNWIEVGYRRLPVAEDDALRLTNHLSGAAAVTLTGFTTSALHLYDITRPLTPTRLVSATAWLSGATYAVALEDTAPAGTSFLAVAEGAVRDAVPTIYHPPDDLIDPSEGADEIIVAPAEFIAAVQPLADRRRSQGLRVRVVDVDDVYALFNGGIFHPEAIRAFAAHAYDNWPDPNPAYLFLVGDGNFNFKGYNPEGYGAAPTWMPPYLEFADPDQGEVAVDSRFGDVDGDGAPEVMVGRVPASTVAQVQGFVAKALAYESAPDAPWMERALMVADDGKTENENFSGILDGLAGYLPTGMEVSKVYLENFCAPPSFNPCLSATHALTRAWNEGAVLLTYAGHAAPWQWADEPLIYNTQLTGLTNTTALPFLISLDCHDANWIWSQHPGHPDKDMRPFGEWVTTVLTDRGAIAAFGPAGLGYPSIEEQMTEAMYQALFEEGVLELGALTQVGREAVSPSYMARTYTLLGDPAMRLRIPMQHYIYLPMVTRGFVAGEGR